MASLAVSGCQGAGSDPSSRNGFGESSRRKGIAGGEGVCLSQQAGPGWKDGRVAALAGVLLFQGHFPTLHLTQHFYLCLLKQNRGIWTRNSGKSLIFGKSLPIKALPASPS